MDSNLFIEGVPSQQTYLPTSTPISYLLTGTAALSFHIWWVVRSETQVIGAFGVRDWSAFGCLHGAANTQWVKSSKVDQLIDTDSATKKAVDLDVCVREKECCRVVLQWCNLFFSLWATFITCRGLSFKLPASTQRTPSPHTHTHTFSAVLSFKCVCACTYTSLSRLAR